MNAAKKRVYFLNGLPNPGPSTRTFEDFIRQLIKAEATGDPTILPTENKTRNKKSKIQIINEEHPQLIHQIFRYACNTIGKKASFPKLVEVMNARLQSLEYEIYLKTHNICEWFHANKGKLKAEKFVPLLTEEKKAQRVLWCQW